MMRRSKWIIMFTLFILGLTGCSSRDSRLMRISELAGDAPQQALKSLDSINPAALKGEDLYFYDLLRVKASDKAYVPHTSDSLIRPVLDYYEDRHNNPNHLEALYYGGRVYQELGDFPTALSYYQKVLKEIGDSERDKNGIKGNTLAQVIYILKSLRIDKEAIPYIHQLIELDKKENDSIHLALDYTYLAEAFLDCGEYRNAINVLGMGEKFNPGDSMVEGGINLYYASAYNSLDNVDSALNYLRRGMETLDTNSLDFTYSKAASIYYQAQKYDTAAYYARLLIGLKEGESKKNGYKILMTPEIRSSLPSDTVIKYISDYKDEMEREFNFNANRAALMQNGLYNYQKHEDDKEKAESNNLQLRYIIEGLVLLILIGGIMYLNQRNRYNRQQVKYHDSLDVLQRIQTKITTGIINQPVDVREALQNKLLELQASGALRTEVSSEILNSAVYKELGDRIHKEEFIPADDPLWMTLEDAVVKSSPDFRNNIETLFGSKLKKSDLHIILLIKCGVGPGDMKNLLARSKGTISNRRISLAEKAFDKKMSTNLIDDIIRSL